MKKVFTLMAALCCSFLFAQDNTEQKANYVGTVSYMEYVTSLASRSSDLIPSDNSIKEAKDKRSLGNQIVIGKDPQTQDDYFVRNRNPKEQSKQIKAPSLVFDAYASGSQPTDPSLAVGPNHVMVVFNTGFTIYDKAGNQLVPQTAPNPAIFPSGGCCDLTASYDNAADRWVLTFLGNGAQIAVSDGPNPVTSGWYVYTINAINDYQKLSVWSDGYYMTDNTGSSNKVWALERDAMLAGNPGAQILGFNLPGIATSGFYSPQAFNVTDNNLPAAGGAPIVYLQDDAWSGVSSDHVKLWTIDVNWTSPGSSTISAAQQISTTPFISVFDNGSFSNLKQPGPGRKINVDALQATIMNQAQFRKFAGHNSAVFNFVVDTDAGNGELAGVRWYEFRQSGDNQPWSLYQEGTYTAANGKHAWNASLAMDASGNIGMGYTAMTGPSTGSTIYISSYYTGRSSTDPLGTMTAAEELISLGDAKIPGTRYGDYSKIDVDPSDDETFWFINEYMNNGRKGVVGVFKFAPVVPDTQPPSIPTNLTADNVTSNSAILNWTASTDNVGVTHYNISLDGNFVGTSTSTSFNLTGLDPLTTYNATVNAEDAAGNVSGNASVGFTTLDGGTGNGEIAAYYFETGWQGWTDGGNDCQRQASANSFEGSYSIRLRDDSSTSLAFSPALDLSGNSQVEIEFHTYANSMENGENFFVEFSDGGAYQVIGQYFSGTDFNNGAFFTDTIVLSSASYTFNANNRFRIRCNASANNDQIWFDQVIITGDAAAPAIENPVDPAVSFNLENENTIKLFPNPAQTFLNIKMTEAHFEQIYIFNSAGKLMHTIDNTTRDMNVDVSSYTSGTYFVSFVKNGRALTKRFIKN
ncbi:MAG: T9SS type A sorting domain-containing protein [Bacteroidia bacterium]|nr:T9SS type A sorting domain-containing protein [Bacteroidia bacterium]